MKTIKLKINGFKVEATKKDIMNLLQISEEKEEKVVKTEKRKYTKRKPRLHKKWTTAENVLLTSMHKEGKSLSKMAKELGRNKGSVYQHLNKVLI